MLGIRRVVRGKLNVVQKADLGTGLQNSVHLLAAKNAWGGGVANDELWKCFFENDGLTKKGKSTPETSQIFT